MHKAKNNNKYLTIVLVLAVVFFATIVLMECILLRGIKSGQFLSQEPPGLADNLPDQSPQASPSPVPASAEPEESEPTPEAIVTPTPEPTPEPTPSVTLEPEIAQMMDQIEEQISEVRLLEMSERIPRKVYSRDELREFVREEMLEDLDEEAESNNVRFYNLLGLLPEGLEMKTLLEDLYSEQIAGFYTIEDREMVVVAGDEFGISERLTYAHEYVHALQYANFDIENGLGYNEDDCQEDSERCLAIQALIEGDANLSQFLWFENHATRADIMELILSFEETESHVLDSAPAYLTTSMMFPYEQGTAFVQYLYSINGFDTINEAFTTTPPVSAEQIMFPERYPDDLPIEVDLPDVLAALGEDWEIDHDGVVGAWDSYLMLSKGYDERFQIDEDVALAAVEGWGGDAYALLKNESQDEFLFIMNTTWDTEEDQREAWNAFSAMLKLRFGSPGYDGLFSKDGTFARLFKTDEKGFVLILSETLDGLESLYDFLSE